MAVPDGWYNGTLLEHNRAIRYSHETRHPLQVQYDREHGIRRCFAPVVSSGRSVDHLTPEECEFADYYEVGFEHRQQQQGNVGFEGEMAADAGDDASKGGCGFAKLFRCIRGIFGRNR